MNRSLFVRGWIAALLVAVGLVASAAPALAVAAAAGPGSYAAGYVTRVVAVPAGGSVTFLNGDVATHTLTADKYLAKKVARKTKRCKGYPKGSCPAFTTPSVGSGETADVAGVSALPSGQYGFHCQIHSNMTGTLVVGPKP